nr:immunoglobulin heavy chain junction region [Macaca mulatta]
CAGSGVTPTDHW